MHTPSARATRRFVATTVAVAAFATAATTPLGVTAAQAAPRTAASAPAEYPPALAPYYTQSLAWAPCRDGLDCAWLTVPLDYDDPSGATIRLRLARATATGPADQRQGSLVVNPGGPGASGLDYAAYVASALAPRVATQFDIVGFDTRGVGQSAPVTCMTGRQTTTWLRTDLTPDSRAEQDRLMSVAARIPAGCLEMSPGIARHVGTENTVRDLDIMRQALGDARLNWLGFSYGTYLGTLYAEEFPDTVGRFVLDGALDPSLGVMEVSRDQSSGFQQAMSRFARDCAARASCPFSGPTASVLRGINRVLARIERQPLPTQRGRTLVQAEALTALFFSMYSPQLWPSLRGALGQARRGNGLGLQALADYSSDRIAPNRYGSNMASAFPAIACWDVPAPPGRAGLLAAARAWSRGVAIPEMARAMSWGNAPCAQWFGHTTRVPAPASTTTTAPILVVGTTYDPATPYPWAQALSRQLPTSTLLTFVGDGHTAYGAGSRCIDDAISAYLLSGTPPAAGTVCR